MHREITTTDIIWLKAPSIILRNKYNVDVYGSVSATILQRSLQTNTKYEFIFDPTDDTINYAGPTTLFSGLIKDLESIGFVQQSIDQKAFFDAKQKEEFKELILRGGTYNG